MPTSRRCRLSAWPPSVAPSANRPSAAAAHWYPAEGGLTTFTRPQRPPQPSCTYWPCPPSAGSSSSNVVCGAIVPRLGLGDPGADDVHRGQCAATVLLMCACGGAATRVASTAGAAMMPMRLMAIDARHAHLGPDRPRTGYPVRENG